MAAECGIHSGRAIYPGHLKIKTDKAASEMNISDIKMWFRNPSNSNKKKIYCNRIRKYLGQIK
jgi:hypothetical protein